MIKNYFGCEGGFNHHRVHSPKRDFLVFEVKDVHKWLYKCNQYFEVEDIEDSEKLKLASCYCDGITLYWH